MESATSSLPAKTQTWVDEAVGWLTTKFGPAFGYNFDFSLESLIEVDEFLSKMSVGMKRLSEEEYRKKRWVVANVTAAYMGETIVKNYPAARLVLLQNDQLAITSPSSIGTHHVAYLANKALKKLDDPEHESVAALITMFLVLSKP